MGSQTYTTTEISRICDVYPATVINWIDSGELKAYVTPGGHRRVTRQDLIDFLKKFKIPIPPQIVSTQRSIFIVDDDEEFLRLLSRAFGKHKEIFTVHAAASGVEALVQIGQKIPDLVILDVVMPGLDGLQVCSRLRSMPETSKMKIIAMSGKRTLSEKEVRSQGIHVFFRKPFSLVDIVDAAARLLKVSLPVSDMEAV
ncbi:MAG: response regulator [Elusimicrobia bacterium]|nr:response regulator [Elusimicrobiota bacterium]